MDQCPAPEKRAAHNIIIRPWQEGDCEGVWSVLCEGSYSNINATFMIILRKPLLRIVTVLLLGVGLTKGLSPILLLVVAFAGVALIYFMSFLGAVVYLYGSTLSDIKDIKLSYFSDTDHHFWVAECDTEIAGTIAIVRKTSPLKGSPSDSAMSDDDSQNAKVAWLRRMAVKRKYRGLGIAKQLVKESVDFCRSQNYHKVFLITTEVHHAARSLYSNMGFELIACKPYRYINGLVTVETFEFEMTL